MKSRKYDGADVRRILCGMIADDKVCAKVSKNWGVDGAGLFDSNWANQIGRMAIAHHMQYGRAPKTEMNAIFEQWAATSNAEEKVIEKAEQFLTGLSNEYQEEPSDFILDLAGRYFNNVQMLAAMEEAKAEIEGGRSEDAQTRLSRVKRINLGSGSYIEPAADSSVWAEAFNRERVRPLVTYPNDLGGFIGDCLCRDSLFSFMAPDKTGKTTWLVDLAYRAARNRNRVAMFDMGDGSQEELIVRLACRVTQRPEYASSVFTPSGWDDKGELIRAEKMMEEVDHFEGFKKFKKHCKAPDAFRISCHENSSTSVADVDAMLQEWEDDGWRPDVIVIDYADIMAPPKGFRDSLEQIDELWKQLRRLSQRRHALVMTATQSASSAYKKTDGGLLTKADFSGRKTKIAHVNGMLGINVNSKEKDLHMARINWIVRRKGHYNDQHYCRVAGSLDVGNPCIISKR
jgi:replicative DNA helicase